MHIAFCLLRYTPYSGLAKDMLRVAVEAQQRNHTLVIFTYRWDGPIPLGIEVESVPAAGHSNHQRAWSFHRHLQPLLAAGDFDVVVGFNKLPGLDVYYAADSCFAAKARYNRHPAYRLTPRYRRFGALEHAVFAPEGRCQVLVLTPQARSEYQEFYLTPDYRFTDLPPTIASQYQTPPNRAHARHQLNAELGLADTDLPVFVVGSGFKTKGVDRAIRALAALPADLLHAHLVVVGQGEPGLYQRIAEQLNVRRRVHFLGGRDDVRQLLAAAELLLHSARNENTGTVIVEAIVSGTPVLTTEVCGYAEHVKRAGAGVVMRGPFEQHGLNIELARTLNSDRNQWRQNGIAYGEDPGLFSMPQAAVEAIEKAACNDHQHSLQRSSIYLSDRLRTDLKTNADFEQIMTLTGEVYRTAPARNTLRFIRNHNGYFLKTHHGVGWREIVKNLSYFRLPVTGAQNEWHASHRLRRLGVSVPPVDGFSVHGHNPARQRSFIITAEIVDSVSLEKLCAGWGNAGAETFLFKRRLINMIAAIARTLHQNGVNHRDFYLCHFLLTRDDNDLVQLFLIDLHRTQLRRKTPARWIVKDLAGLYYSAMDIGLSRRDLFRFMCSYTGQSLRATLAGNVDWPLVQRRAHNLHQNQRPSRLATSAHKA